LKPFKKQLDGMTPEQMLAEMKKQSVISADVKALYDSYVADPEKLKRDLKSMRREIEKLVKNTQDVAKRGYKDRKETLENYKLPSRKIKVKAYARKGKLVQTFERLNPFYNKDKRNKDK
jgi:imidazolonepropionase-like amidohydrolase